MWDYLHIFIFLLPHIGDLLGFNRLHSPLTQRARLCVYAELQGQMVIEHVLQCRCLFAVGVGGGLHTTYMLKRVLMPVDTCVCV